MTQETADMHAFGGHGGGSQQRLGARDPRPSIGNQVPAGVTGLPEALRASHSGAARVIAISGNQRSRLPPQTPTFKELGVPGLEFYTFVGCFAPKGLPRPMAEEFNAALRKTLADPAGATPGVPAPHSRYRPRHPSAQVPAPPWG
ncbi:tripartite tricarboxylate transporter substrate-binding protein [Pseudorhodoferax sp.]|uniref:tripartite tricarboxylate transporter substrate-binding protein n=1 Tax=Pseudorhodoferax sp. TaxID=1993553 RepID=UPI0039E5DE2F